MTRKGRRTLDDFLEALRVGKEHELIQYNDRFYDECIARIVWRLLCEHCNSGWMRSELQSLELEAQMAQL